MLKEIIIIMISLFYLDVFHFIKFKSYTIIIINKEIIIIRNIKLKVFIQ